MGKKPSRIARRECREIAKELQKELPEYRIRAGNPGIIVQGWYREEISHRTLKKAIQKYSMAQIREKIEEMFSVY